MMTYTDRKKDTVKESTSRMILFKLDKFKQKNIGCGCETLLQRNSWSPSQYLKKHYHNKT